MRYPLMNEEQLAARWNISDKTLRRWRVGRRGPVYRKLGRLVRYFEEDIQEFEQRSARHWMTLLGQDENRPIVLSLPGGVDQTEGDPTFPIYIDAKEAAVMTGLPLYFFADRNRRERKRLPYLSLIGNVRYSLEEIYRWEQANAVPAFGPKAPQPPELPAEECSSSGCVPRWYEMSTPYRR